jgi:hypothetical protein
VRRGGRLAPRRAAERSQVSPTTAAWWADRYRQSGPAGMADWSSRPRRSPGQLPRRTEHRIIGLRVTARLGPARIGFRLGLHPSTVHRVLRRYRCHRLAHLDRATAIPVRRSERDRPGELVHVNVKKLGNIPDGGGWRVTGKAAGTRNSQAHRDPARSRTRHGRPDLGYGYLHTALDDHSRLADTEILADETGPTAVAFLARAAWYSQLGIIIERALSDIQRQLLRRPSLGPELRPARDHPKRTRPPRPQTNGRWKDSTAPWPTNGPTPVPTAPKPSAAPPCPTGSTPTAITADTLHAAATRPCQVSTASRPL